MARRKNADGVEVEVPDTVITDAPEFVAPEAVVEVEAAAPEMTEQTKAEMAEGRRMLEKRNAEVAAATASRDAAEAAQKSE